MSAKSIGEKLGGFGSAAVTFITTGSPSASVEAYAAGKEAGGKAGEVYSDYIAPALDWVFGSEASGSDPVPPKTIEQITNRPEVLNVAIENATKHQFQKNSAHAHLFSIEENVAEVVNGTLMEIVNWFNSTGNPLTPDEYLYVQYKLNYMWTNPDAANLYSLLSSVVTIGQLAAQAQASEQEKALQRAAENSRLQSQFYAKQKSGAISAQSKAAEQAETMVSGPSPNESKAGKVIPWVIGLGIVGKVLRIF